MDLGSTCQVGIFLMEGLTDGLWRASLVSEFLEAQGYDSFIVIGDRWLDRNRVELSFLRDCLGLSGAIHENSLKKFGEVVFIGLDDFSGEVVLHKRLEGKVVCVKPDSINIRKFAERVGLPAFKSADFESTLPYSTKISTQIRNGSLSRCFEAQACDQLYLHCRLGDVAILSGRDLVEIFDIDQKYQGKVFCRRRFLGLQGFRELKQNPVARFLPIAAYINFLRSVSGKFKSIVLSTDGFTRVALGLKNEFPEIGLSLDSIERRLNDFYFGGNELRSLTIISGETSIDFQRSLFACAESNCWQQGSSGFPFELFIRSGLIRPYFSPALKKSYKWRGSYLSESHFELLSMSFEDSLNNCYFI